MSEYLRGSYDDALRANVTLLARAQEAESSLSKALARVAELRDRLQDIADFAVDDPTESVTGIYQRLANGMRHIATCAISLDDDAALHREPGDDIRCPDCGSGRVHRCAVDRFHCTDCDTCWKPESSLSKALARVAELEGQWDIGFTEGLVAMREKAAKLVENKFPLDPGAAHDLAVAIRALPLTQDSADPVDDGCYD